MSERTYPLCGTSGLRTHGLRLLLTIAACVSASPVATQAPASTTTAFDGNYVGTATVGRGRATTTCWAINSMDMTITGGQVVIHAIRFTGNEPTLQGSVNTAGEVLASLQIGSYFFFMSGTIHDKVFTGQRLVAQCYYSVQMQIAPPPTMPFDGEYVGVSRKVIEAGERPRRQVSAGRSLGAADDIERRRLVAWSWLARDRHPAGCRGYAERQVNPTKRPD